jgi:6-pyruvoyltetrahydropterin/6-carboxytetrahydropterin synthase
MIATIAKRFTFDAAHRLLTCPEGHKCRRLHGHTYTVEVVLQGPVNPATGFVVDYDHIAKAWEPLNAMLDHQYLNDVPGLELPSTEVLAVWIAKKLVDEGDFLLGTPIEYTDEHGHRGYRETTLVTDVRIEESSTTWCQVDVDHCGTKRKAWIDHRVPMNPMAAMRFLAT